MTQEKMSPLRERMMEDMRIRGKGDKAQKSHIRAIHCPAVAACSDERATTPAPITPGFV